MPILNKWASKTLPMEKMEIAGSQMSPKEKEQYNIISRRIKNLNLPTVEVSDKVKQELIELIKNTS